MKKMVLFGAGKIGRSFIGQLFSLSGYEIVFVDVYRPVVEALNRRGGYDVVVKSDGRDEIIHVDNVRGVLADDTGHVAGELSDCDIAAVSVGLKGLTGVVGLMAKGLRLRLSLYGSCPLDIIIAENIRDGADHVRGLLKDALGDDFPLDGMAGLVETSIGKMVPIMLAGEQERDPLLVYAEPYNTLIVDGKGFLGPVPQVKGLMPKDNIRAWVDRKAYIHNFGHAAAAYAGYRVRPDAVCLWQVLEDAAVATHVRRAMRQSAEVLARKYPEEFSSGDLEVHIEDLISRFGNKALGDTVFRVGCDLVRKLSRQDRVLSPLRDAVGMGLPSETILKVFTDGLAFGAVDEKGDMFPGDAAFVAALREKELPWVLENVCGLDPVTDEEVTNMIMAAAMRNDGEKILDRRGIISVGNWLVDNVKMIDRYPERGNLTTIDRVTTGLGGCSHNVLVDLAKMETGLPLYAGGCIGNDEGGGMILDAIAQHGIDASHMVVLDDVATSYTDVMSETGGGATRTFFHFRGANARLAPIHFTHIDSPARIFHLGYLLLLDELDKPDPEYGTVAARVLDGLSKKGYEISVDVVSEEGDRFRQLVGPCLPYTDYFIVNEVEAGACCGEELRDGCGEIILYKVRAAAEKLLCGGVRKLVVIHFPEGGYAMDAAGRECYVPSDKMPPEEIVSSVGAGDAFCAGALYAIHEGLPMYDMLALANTSARFNLRSDTSTGGAPAYAQIRTWVMNAKSNIFKNIRL